MSGTGSVADPGPFVEALQQGMREQGYVDGKDFIVEYRGAEGRQARIPELVAELVQAKVDVLVTPFPTAIRAAKQATDTIPIVMVTSIDPVASGIIDSLAKPGGNITGLFMLTRDLSAKRLEFLKDVVPKLARVGILVDADEPVVATGYRDYEAPARALQMELRSLEVRGPNPDLDAAIKAALEWHAEALIIVTSSLLFSHRKAIADLALKSRLPTAYHGSDWVVAGGLMSYSADDLAVFRRAAYYIHRILRGSQAPRSSGGAADEVPARDQSEDRQSARPFYSAAIACVCRRGDRIASAHGMLLHLLTAGSGTTRTFRNVRYSVAVGVKADIERAWLS